MASASTQQTNLEKVELDQLINRVAELKVGGTYWGAQPKLPDQPYTLVRVAGGSAGANAAEVADSPAVEWSLSGRGGVFSGECDPWHMIGGATRVVVDADNELALIASIAGVPLRCVGAGRFASLQTGDRSPLREAFRVAAEGVSYADPFTGHPIDLAAAIEICGFWRSLIDSNRQITAAVGFAFWKRDTTAPLLWGGTARVPFSSGRRAWGDGDTVAVWKSRTAPQMLAKLETSRADLVEAEDGFIRSAGLGADCVPPLSIVLDSRGIYFDPEKPSDLEQILQCGSFSDDILRRARHLRKLIVERGISKYASAGMRLDRRDEVKRHLLVPGQVEDDRSVTCGGGTLTTNLELLRRVRGRCPDAYIIYKPHPDVVAGHRIGDIRDEVSLTLANEVVRETPISSLIEMVDEVHVNTSLAGFEALLRLKAVTTYGVPFFAGWGLTTDVGQVPQRRSAKRNLDELVAAVLLLYPRYLDPATGLPCPPEILVQRLSDRSTKNPSGPLVRLRRLQGHLKRVMLALQLRR